MRYALDIVRASRPKSPTAPDTIKKWAAFGASVRAAQHLILGGKARALTNGRYHVSFEDVRALAHPILRHRVLTNFHAQSEGVTSDALVDKLLEAVPMPQVGDVELLQLWLTHTVVSQVRSSRTGGIVEMASATSTGFSNVTSCSLGSSPDLLRETVNGAGI